MNKPPNKNLNNNFKSDFPTEKSDLKLNSLVSGIKETHKDTIHDVSLLFSTNVSRTTPQSLPIINNTIGCLYNIQNLTTRSTDKNITLSNNFDNIQIPSHLSSYSETISSVENNTQTISSFDSITNTEYRTNTDKKSNLNILKNRKGDNTQSAFNIQFKNLESKLLTHINMSITSIDSRLKIVNTTVSTYKEELTKLEEKATKNLDIHKVELNTLVSTATTSFETHKVDIHKQLVEHKDELKETRNSVLGTIALFAAFFTFVSVNVNIFTKAENVTQSIIFMLSFWLCIIGFISLFFLFLNKNKDTIIFKTTEFITTASCILLSAGLMYLLFNNSDSESYKKINDKLVKIQEENDSLKKENFALNEKINKNFKALDEQVIELRKNQYQLNQQ